MPRRQPFKISMCRCTECSSYFPIPRMASRFRGKNHIKDIWCFKCHKITKFIENECG